MASLVAPAGDSNSVSSAATADSAALPARSSDSDSYVTAAAAAHATVMAGSAPDIAWPVSQKAVPGRRAAAAAARAAVALDSTVLDGGSSGSEVEDHNDFDYLPCTSGSEVEYHAESDWLPGSTRLVESTSSEPTRSLVVADKLHHCAPASEGAGIFRTICWECRFGCFAMRKNSRHRCREVYCHVGPDWASQAAKSRPLPEQPPPSEAASDFGAQCATAADVAGNPAPALGCVDSAPKAGKEPTQRTRCWKCSMARSHKGWRHCREVLRHTGPDIKTWRTSWSRRGAGSERRVCAAKATAGVEPWRSSRAPIRSSQSANCCLKYCLYCCIMQLYSFCSDLLLFWQYVISILL
jgi:hypothetical protein